ncbi:hypothetical protein DU508_22940 [Pedobacter chinensis]|uniref:Uncharacterized protein n=1 Tax=Pedobacter chinensis TaxID=2282421 RepID=A0A369PPJ6_9SPHI|nr:hypothetical protein DU508_22940 [Pedobacter chinensis]
MSTKQIILFSIIFLIIVIIYQIVVFVSFRKKTKNHKSENALSLFFKISPIRNFIYYLFIKNKITKKEEQNRKIK